MRPLIIGYGSPSRGDDAVGYLAAERLGGMAVHQLTPELAQDIAGAARVIFIDAADAAGVGEAVAGEIHEHAISPASAPGSFTHHCTPESLLAMARDLYGHAPAATLYTITAESFAFGAPLTPVVQSALDRLLARLLNAP